MVPQAGKPAARDKYSAGLGQGTVLIHDIERAAEKHRVNTACRQARGLTRAHRPGSRLALRICDSNCSHGIVWLDGADRQPVPEQLLCELARACADIGYRPGGLAANLLQQALDCSAAVVGSLVVMWSVLGVIPGNFARGDAVAHGLRCSVWCSVRVFTAGYAFMR